MLTPVDLKLPYPAWTPGQWETLAQVAAHLAQPNPDPVILEAPTGVGKSAIAIGLAHLLNSPKTVVLTGTKQLQGQYQRAFDSAHSIMGRSNYICAIDINKTAANAVCTVGVPCAHKKDGQCGYYAQKAIAVEHPEVITNYPYWLAQANYAHKLLPDLLICDEAHTLEDEVRRFAGVEIRDRQLDLVQGGNHTNPQSISEWVSWANNFLLQFRQEYREAQANKMHASTSEITYYSAVIALYRAAQTLSSPAVDDDHWIREESKYGQNLKPLWVQKHAQDYVFRHAHRVLLMSATVLDPEVFRWTLGLDPSSPFIQVPSPFPPANRPLIYQSVGRVKGGKELAGVLPRLVDALDDILESHPTERGLVHTVSYEIASNLKQRSRHRGRLLIHDAKSRMSVLETFKATPGAVLVSPSMTTGVDLPYDLLRFQVIAKLSFPNLGDPQIKKRMKLGPDGLPSPLAQRWYNWLTACTLVQTYGRGVRAVDDACVTYLLDGNFSWWRNTVKNILPIWFTEAIKNLGDYIPRKSAVDRALEDYASMPLARTDPTVPPKPQPLKLGDIRL